MGIIPYTQKSYYYYSMRKFYLRGRKKGTGEFSAL